MTISTWRNTARPKRPRPAPAQPWSPAQPGPVPEEEQLAAWVRELARGPLV
ncbi:hypothetical protein [Cyanobium sp. Copco_Reservoir_LC18]|uniref:hypothetical protein n=1 Tax=Cyanobium sp. Copco_Reservoir_LC18 TaxID=1328305 RepID=UPI0013573083|nr:hypothetical protein [Cyanobium sp. Copco_Reservoir_LC18]